MSSQVLTTNVSAVPNSVTQRIASSLPLGMNTRKSANSVGRKITADIMIRSYSGGKFIGSLFAGRQMSEVRGPYAEGVACHAGVFTPEALHITAQGRAAHPGI